MKYSLLFLPVLLVMPMTASAQKEQKSPGANDISSRKGNPGGLLIRDTKAAGKKAAGDSHKKKVKRVRPSWIWSELGERPNAEVVHFRKTFELKGGRKAAVLSVTCDNHYEAWINGKLVGKGDNWAQPGQFEIRKDVKNGENVIAIRGRNAGGIAGLAASLEITTTGKEEKVQVVTDGSWRVSSKEEKGWQEAGFNDSAWSKPKVHGRMGMNPWGPVMGRSSAGGRTASIARGPDRGLQGCQGLPAGEALYGSQIPGIMGCDGSASGWTPHRV